MKINENKIFEYIEISYDKLTNQINTWLKGVYSKSNILFSEASPYGMILRESKEMFTHTMTYLKNAVNQIDIATSNVRKVIINTARISGHNPSRGISANGTIKMKLKPGISVFDEIKGGKITINNKTTIKNKSNNLYYALVLGTDKMLLDITPGSEFYFSVIQGKYETQTFTGDGTKNQSISVNVPNNKMIENFNFSVIYNGFPLALKDHMYDMVSNEYACFTRTGFNGGMDVYFGNGSYGFIPSIGSRIEVQYILTDGVNGNILNPKVNDFKFIDDVFDEENNIIEINKVFDIFITTNINMGSDGESVNYMKSVIPYISRNFVLESPNQFIYHLRKLNLFSKINAYNLLDEKSINSSKYLDYFINNTFGSIQGVNKEDVKNKMKYYFPNVYDNQIFLYLIPKIKNYFTSDYNYFNVPFDVFYLDDEEKAKVMSYLKKMGTINLTTNINIIDPIISLYCVNIFVRRYNNIPEESLRNDIIQNISDYFINNERFDRIVKSDLITNIKNNVSGIDSINLEFICKKNEDYHRKNKQLSGTTTILYDPNTKLGLDPIQGDIVVDKDELAVLRGAFYDRNGIWYNDTPSIDTLSSINIIVTGQNDNTRYSS